MSLCYIKLLQFAIVFILCIIIAHLKVPVVSFNDYFEIVAVFKSTEISQFRYFVSFLRLSWKSKIEWDQLIFVRKLAEFTFENVENGDIAKEFADIDAHVHLLEEQIWHRIAIFCCFLEGFSAFDEPPHALSHVFQSNFEAVHVIHVLIKLVKANIEAEHAIVVKLATNFIIEILDLQFFALLWLPVIFELEAARVVVQVHVQNEVEYLLYVLF